MDIRRNIGRYLYGDVTSAGVQPTERYASFDYCYNYFQSFREHGIQHMLADQVHIQASCLQIGFYLASWGMLRGRSFLLKKSVKHYEPLIQEIASFAPDIWSIDVDQYTDANIDILLTSGRKIASAIGQGKSVTSTLVTKIMLGVFGNIPAFDRYFRQGLGINSLHRISLVKISAFYQAHKAIIDTYSIPTTDYHTGEKTHRLYPKAKLVDMIGFIQGGEQDTAE